jgi:hypothetical protein
MRLGLFLDDWRDAEPHWTATHIEIAPAQAASAAGGEIPLHITIVFEAIFSDAGGAP